MARRVIPKDEHPKILSMYSQGKTYQEIADIYGVTKQAIGLIAAKNGVKWTDGGAHALHVERKQKESAERDARCLEKHGYTLAEYKRIINAQTQPPVFAYRQQRNNARARGIEWKFNFREWWSVWEESGQWENRGREHGNYCMARFGDTGPYEIGNVEIVTVTQNICEVRMREALARKGGSDNCEAD